MRTSNTFTILYLISSSRAKIYLTTVFARITVDGKRATISLKLKADIRSWDNVDELIYPFTSLVMFTGLFPKEYLNSSMGVIYK